MRENQVSSGWLTRLKVTEGDAHMDERAASSLYHIPLLHLLFLPYQRDYSVATGPTDGVEGNVSFNVP